MTHPTSLMAQRMQHSNEYAILTLLHEQEDQLETCIVQENIKPLAEL